MARGTKIVLKRNAVDRPPARAFFGAIWGEGVRAWSGVFDRADLRDDWMGA